MLNIGRKFKGSPIYKAASFIMLWKVIAKTPNSFLWYGTHEFEYLCAEYIRENIDEKENTEKYKKFKENLSQCTKYLRLVSLLFSCRHRHKVQY